MDVDPEPNEVLMKDTSGNKRLFAKGKQLSSEMQMI